MEPVKRTNPLGPLLIALAGILVLLPVYYIFGIGGNLLGLLIAALLYFTATMVLVFGIYGFGF